MITNMNEQRKRKAEEFFQKARIEHLRQEQIRRQIESQKMKSRPKSKKRIPFSNLI